MPRRSSRSALSVKMAELSLAAPQVIALRFARALAAGATPSASDWREYSRMWIEKVEASNESAIAGALQMAEMNRQWMMSLMRPWWGMWLDPAALMRTWTNASRGLGSASTRKRIEHSLSQLALASVTPYHRRATRNQRRLSRRALRTRRLT